MKSGCMNMPSKEGPARWQRGWRIMARRTIVFGVNETFLKRCKAVYLSLALAGGWRFYGLRRGPNVLFWKQRHWKFVSGEIRTLHGYGPNRDKWPGFNDQRYMTMTTLRRRLANGFGRTHLFIVTHWVADAGQAKTPQDWIDRMRVLSKEALLVAVREGIEAGQCVHVMGDFNYGGLIGIKVPGSTTYQVRATGIDKYIIVVPDGVVVEHDFEMVEIPSDHHDAPIITATFSKAV